MRRKGNCFGYTSSFVGGGTPPATIVLSISLHVKYISCVTEVGDGYYSSVSFLSWLKFHQITRTHPHAHIAVHSGTLACSFGVALYDPM